MYPRYEFGKQVGTAVVKKAYQPGYSMDDDNDNEDDA